MLTRLVKVAAVPAVALALVWANPGIASAQEAGAITGSVVDSEGQPLQGVQVHIPATQQGILSNEQGRFVLLNVRAGQHIVRAQMLGYTFSEETVTVTAGGTAEVSFTLGVDAISVEGIVVTALGIERSERSLGFAVQNMTRQQIEEMPQLNLTAALQGKTAGIQVTNTSSRPGASSRVVIRGESSFTGGGQPLYVIDGMPLQMNTEEQGGFDLEVGQAGSRSMDLDMNNIEELTVLRGAAATALYGSRAAHGAIIIKTKQGQAGAPTRFTLNTRYEFQDAILEGYQSQYTAGRDGYYCNGLREGYGGWCEPDYYNIGGYSSPTTNRAWGPHKDNVSAAVMAHECPGETDPTKCIRMVDPREDFYQQGRLSETSLNATGGLGSGGFFNLGGTYAHHSGITPQTTLERLNLNANVTLPLTDRLNTNTVVMYSNTGNNWLTEGWRSLEQDLWYKTPNMDVRKAWNEDGTPVLWGGNEPHPFWLAENGQRTSSTDRWIASQFFEFDISDNLKISNRLGFDTYNESRTFNSGERPWRTEIGQTSGSTRQERFTRTSINNDLVLSLANLSVKEGFTVSGLAGFNILDRSNEDLTGEGDDIIIPSLYNLYNFLDQDVSGRLIENRRLLGLYGQATAGYQDWAYLNLTARNDWSSTLPLDNNSYFYPSAALSVVFTEALGWQSKWLDYGKLRLSMAKVGSDAPPYRLRTSYFGAGNVEWPFLGTQGFLQGNSLGNPVLKPESTTEYEIGADLRFLQGRAMLEFSYYDKKSYDQIFSVSSTPATGFHSITRNAGDLRNEGWEVTLQTVPFQSPNTRWDLVANWSKNRSTVKELAPGVTNIYLAGYSWPNIRIQRDEAYGVIWGNGFERTEDGQVLIGEDGWPIMDDQLIVLGNVQPDWLGNLYTSFRYGPFRLSGLINHVQGGDVFNFTLNYTVGRGVHNWTLERGSTFVYPGIRKSTGQPNDIEIVKDENYFRRELGGYLRSENNVEKGTATYLQELTLQYSLPQDILDRVGMGPTQLYVTGHNLAIWTDFSLGDPQGSNYGDTNAGGQYYHMFVAPSLSSFSVGLRTNF